MEIPHSEIIKKFHGKFIWFWPIKSHKTFHGTPSSSTWQKPIGFPWKYEYHVEFH